VTKGERREGERERERERVSETMRYTERELSSLSYFVIILVFHLPKK